MYFFPPLNKSVNLFPPFNVFKWSKTLISLIYFSLISLIFVVFFCLAQLFVLFSQCFLSMCLILRVSLHWQFEIKTLKIINKEFTSRFFWHALIIRKIAKIICTCSLTSPEDQQPHTQHITTVTEETVRTLFMNI